MKIIFPAFLFFIIISAYKIQSQPSGASAYSISVVVSDIDASAARYTWNLGLRVRDKLEIRARGIKIVNLENSNTLVELLQINDSANKEEILKEYPVGTKLTGFFKSGFRVDNFDDWHRYLEK